MPCFLYMIVGLSGFGENGLGGGTNSEDEHDENVMLTQKWGLGG